MTRRLLRSLALLLVTFVAEVEAASIQDLTTTPRVSDVKISPDGKYLALLVFNDGKHDLQFFDRESREFVGGSTIFRDYEPVDVTWANNERVVGEIVALDRGPRSITYGELFGVNFDGTKGELIFGYSSGELRAGTNLPRKTSDWAWADIIDVLPNDDRHILVSVTPYSETYDRRPVAKLLDIYSGIEESGVKEAKHGSGTFYTDHLGEIRFVTSVTADGRIHAESLPSVGGDWVEIPETLPGDVFRPIAVAGDLQSVYVLDNRGNDTVGLHLLSLDGQSYDELYTRERVDITSVNLSIDGRSPYAVRVDDGYATYVFLAAAHEETAVFRALLSVFPGRVVDITSRSMDGRYWVVRTASDVDAGAFYLYDKESGTAALILEPLPDVDEQDLARVVPIEFDSFDGTRVAGYFTQAKPDTSEHPRLVVLLHDGPRMRDYWHYDAIVQALATNGFSVLQINFRGSTGYGRAFRDAGNRQWADAIPRDIIAGTQWAIEQGKAEAGRICTMGTGFGAYAALETVIHESGLFACAIGRAGIYDLPLLYRGSALITIPYTQDVYLEEAIGRNEEELDRSSPVNQVAALNVPVLIAHEKSDALVRFEHARRLREELDRHDKEYEWLESSRDGFYDQGVEIEFLEATLEFLAKHTGGNP